MANETIYLDHNSSTPMAPEVFEAMRPFLTDWHGNAASAHVLGRSLAAAVEEARADLAGLIGGRSDEIVFTSGGTESNNWVLAALADAHDDGHVVVGGVEHFSVALSAERLRRSGFDVTVVAPNAIGRIEVDAVEEALRDDTRLVSVMLAQNEVGTVMPIRAIADAAHAREIPVHTDAAQAVGKIPVHVGDLDVDLLTVAGHKLYGPKGIGALWIRSGRSLGSWMLGAPHERGLRAGTLNTPGIVGLGRAASLAAEHLGDEVPRLCTLSRRLFDGLASRVPAVLLNGPPLDDVARLPNTVNCSFPVRSDRLIAAVPEVATTPGAACHSGDPKPSATLLAMGLEPERALGAVRLSLGRGTTEQEIDRVIELYSAAVERLASA